MPEGPCFNQVWTKILLKDVTPRRADNRVKKECPEIYRIEPGYVFREVAILLPRPMLFGINESKSRIIMPFRKPCFGTSLYSIDANQEEIVRLRLDFRGCGQGTLEKSGRGSEKRKKSGTSSRR